jgi:hypothetical protein
MMQNCQHTFDMSTTTNDAIDATGERDGRRPRVRCRRRRGRGNRNRHNGASDFWWTFAPHPTDENGNELEASAERGYPLLLPSTQAVFLLPTAANPQFAATFLPLKRQTAVFDLGETAMSEPISDAED